MYSADFHTHSHFSPDGAESVRAMAEAALRAGVETLCVTDHCDVNGFDGNGYSAFPGDACLEEIEAVREEFGGRPRIRFGVELGQAPQNPALAAQILRENRFDFVLGSLHNLRDEEDFYFLSYPSAGAADALLSRYLDETLEMCENSDFDVLGHLGYPLRYMRGTLDPCPALEAFEAKIRKIYRALIERGRGIEVNVSGLRHGGEAMPSLPLMKLYRACGGEIVTLGSDAHRARDIGRGIPEGAALLREAGFTRACVYQDRRPDWVPL